MRRFVVFEGIDGSGKSTVSSKVFERLREKRIDAILTHEPFNENIKKCIEVFLKRDADPVSIAMLFIADRIEHSKMIKEWLDQDKIVICDRYEDSTYAYQGAQLEGRMEEPIEFLKRLSPEDIIHPDRIFILDLDPDTALSRLSGNRDFESFEKKSFLQKVRKNYLRLAKDERYKVIDARKDIEEIVEICLKDILGDKNEDRDRL